MRGIVKLIYQRFLLFVAIVVGLALIYYFGLSHFFSLGELKRHGLVLQAFVNNYYLFSVLIYIGALFTAILVGLPIVALFGLAGGYLFGILPGLIYAEIAAILGAVIAFILYRYFFYHAIHVRYHDRLAKFEQEVKKDGASYLLMLQFLGMVPFFIINTIAVLADISLFTVFWTTVVGAFPYLLVYVLAGNQLGSINSLSDLISIKMVALLFLFALLAVIPIVIKKWKKADNSLAGD